MSEVDGHPDEGDALDDLHRRESAYDSAEMTHGLNAGLWKLGKYALGIVGVANVAVAIGSESHRIEGSAVAGATFALAYVAHRQGEQSAAKAATMEFHRTSATRDIDKHIRITDPELDQ